MLCRLAILILQVLSTQFAARLPPINKTLIRTSKAQEFTTFTFGCRGGDAHTVVVVRCKDSVGGRKQPR